MSSLIYFVYTGPCRNRIRCEKRSRAKAMGLEGRPDVLVIDDADWDFYLRRSESKSTRYRYAVEAMSAAHAAKHLPRTARPTMPLFGSPSDLEDAARLRRSMGYPSAAKMEQFTGETLGIPTQHLGALTQEQRDELKQQYLVETEQAPSVDRDAFEREMAALQQQRTNDFRAAKRHAAPSSRGAVARDTPEMVSARSAERAERVYAAATAPAYDVDADVNEWFG